MTTISCVQISNFKNEWYNSLKAPPPTPSFSHSLYLPLPLSHAWFQMEYIAPQ